MYFRFIAEVPKRDSATMVEMAIPERTETMATK